MGKLRLIAETTLRDVVLILHREQVPSSVISRVSSRLASLQRDILDCESYEVSKGFDPNEGRVVGSQVVQQLLDRVFGVEIPNIILRDAEAENRRLAELLRDTEKQRDEALAKVEKAKTLEKRHANAHRFALHSYFREVFQLRSVIAAQTAAVGTPATTTVSPQQQSALPPASAAPSAPVVDRDRDVSMMRTVDGPTVKHQTSFRRPPRQQSGKSITPRDMEGGRMPLPPNSLGFRIGDDFTSVILSHPRDVASSPTEMGTTSWLQDASPLMPPLTNSGVSTSGLRKSSAAPVAHSLAVPSSPAAASNAANRQRSMGNVSPSSATDSGGVNFAAYATDAIFDYETYLDLQRSDEASWETRYQELNSEFTAFMIQSEKDKATLEALHQQAQRKLQGRIAYLLKKLKEEAGRRQSLKSLVQALAETLKSDRLALTKDINTMRKVMERFSKQLQLHIHNIGDYNEVLVDVVKAACKYMSDQWASEANTSKVEEIARFQFQRSLVPHTDDPTNLREAKLYWRQHDISNTLFTTVMEQRQIHEQRIETSTILQHQKRLIQQLQEENLELVRGKVSYAFVGLRSMLTAISSHVNGSDSVIAAHLSTNPSMRRSPSLSLRSASASALLVTPPITSTLTAPSASATATSGPPAVPKTCMEPPLHLSDHDSSSQRRMPSTKSFSSAGKVTDGAPSPSSPVLHRTETTLHTAGSMFLVVPPVTSRLLELHIATRGEGLVPVVTENYDRSERKSLLTRAGDAPLSTTHRPQEQHTPELLSTTTLPVALAAALEGGDDSPPPAHSTFAKLESKKTESPSDAVHEFHQPRFLDLPSIVDSWVGGLPDYRAVGLLLKEKMTVDEVDTMVHDRLMLHRLFALGRDPAMYLRDADRDVILTAWRRHRWMSHQRNALVFQHILVGKMHRCLMVYYENNMKSLLRSIHSTKCAAALKHVSTFNAEEALQDVMMGKSLVIGDEGAEDDAGGVLTNMDPDVLALREALQRLWEVRREADVLYRMKKEVWTNRLIENARWVLLSVERHVILQLRGIFPHAANLRAAAIPEVAVSSPTGRQRELPRTASQVSLIDRRKTVAVQTIIPYPQPGQQPSSTPGSASTQRTRILAALHSPRPPTSLPSNPEVLHMEPPQGAQDTSKWSGGGYRYLVQNTKQFATTHEQDDDASSFFRIESLVPPRCIAIPTTATGAVGTDQLSSMSIKLLTKAAIMTTNAPMRDALEATAAQIDKSPRPLSGPFVRKDVVSQRGSGSRPPSGLRNSTAVPQPAPAVSRACSAASNRSNATSATAHPQQLPNTSHAQRPQSSRIIGTVASRVNMLPPPVYSDPPVSASHSPTADSSSTA